MQNQAFRLSRTFSFLLLATALIIGQQTGVRQARADETALGKRPNVIVILFDDLGYGDLACYGSPIVDTPNLDALAAGGLRCEQFYSAAPVCSASRVGLLTGRSPNRAGVYDWIPPARNPQTNRRDRVHMRRSEITFPSLLQSAGYRTCMAGKWHCNSEFNSATQPTVGDFGFEHWLATANNASPSHNSPSNFVRNGTKVGKTDQFSCQYVIDETLRWLDSIETDSKNTSSNLPNESNQPSDLREQPGSSHPFFTYIALHETHEPVASPPNLVAKYRDRLNAIRNSDVDDKAAAMNRPAVTLAKRVEDHAHYLANIENADLAIGRLVAELENRGIRENTLIIVSSDNGPETLDRYAAANRSMGSPGSFKGMKLWTTEGGIRVPGILNWPAAIAAGQTTRQTISALDIFPTLCELTQTPIPEGLLLDGQSLATSIRPGTNSGPVMFRDFERAKPLFWLYFNATNQQRIALCDGSMKILARLVDPQGNPLPKMTNVFADNRQQIADSHLTDFSVYDLEVDPDEENDVFDSHPQASQLRLEIEKVFAQLCEDSHVW
jgi:arylsulfatase A